MEFIIETRQGWYLKNNRDWRRPNTTTKITEAKKYSTLIKAKSAISKIKNTQASQWNILPVNN